MSSLDYQLVLSPRAQQDIIDILCYTAETWGHDQVLVYRNKLQEAIQTLGQNPMLGHRSAELPKTHRLYIVGSHVVV